MLLETTLSINHWQGDEGRLVILARSPLEIQAISPRGPSSPQRGVPEGRSCTPILDTQPIFTSVAWFNVTARVGERVEGAVWCTSGAEIGRIPALVPGPSELELPPPPQLRLLFFNRVRHADYRFSSPNVGELEHLFRRPCTVNSERMAKSL
jgi:hypothetical protein